MKAEELKSKSEDELKKMLSDLRKEQFNLRFQKSGGQLENTSQIRKTRRTIARVKTFLNQKAEKPAGTAPKAAAAKAKARPAAKSKKAAA